jgi:Na+/melibiose symporter-like transporter
VSDTVVRPRLGFATKFNYGLGAVAQGVATQALATATITLFLFQVVGMPVALVTGLIAVSVMVDACIDPLVGRWSDGFRSRWGRRHPFMYASALPAAGCIFLLWHPPSHLPAALLPVFMLVLLIVVRLCVSLNQIPGDALAPELAPDYHERTSLLAYRFFFGLVGGVGMYVVLNAVFLRKDATHTLGVLNRQGYENFGVLAAVVIFFSILISALATHRYIPFLRPAPQRRLSFIAAVKEVSVVLTNRSLLVVMLSGLISGVVGGMNATLGVFFNLHFWGLSPQLSALLFVIGGVPASLVGVGLAPVVSRLLDKKRTMITVFFISIFTGVIPISLRLLGLMPPNGSPWLFTILVLDGFVAGTLGLMGFIIVSSMIADVVEDAAVKTGVRSEGLLFAANGLLPKFTAAIGTFVGGLMLAAVSFPVHAQQGTVDPQILRHLAFLSLPTSTILSLISTAVLFMYRIDKATHERNLQSLSDAAGLAEARIEQSAAPLTAPFAGPVRPDVA